MDQIMGKTECSAKNHNLFFNGLMCADWLGIVIIKMRTCTVSKKCSHINWGLITFVISNIACVKLRGVNVSSCSPFLSFIIVTVVHCLIGCCFFLHFMLCFVFLRSEIQSFVPCFFWPCPLPCTRHLLIAIVGEAFILATLFGFENSVKTASCGAIVFWEIFSYILSASFQKNLHPRSPQARPPGKVTWPYLRFFGDCTVSIVLKGSILNFREFIRP